LIHPAHIIQGMDPSIVSTSRAANRSQVSFVSNCTRAARAMHVGDVITVNVSVTDTAKMQNTTSRSRTNSDNANLTNLFGLEKVLPPAIDPTLRPYHGEPFEERTETDRSQAKGGTTHVHAYATVYLVRHGRRFTLALTWVTKGEPLAGVIGRLLRAARAIGLRPRHLLLDRGFCSVDVIRFLQAGRHPFLMPLPLRGRPVDHPAGPSGSRVFAVARRSGWGEYTLTNAAGRRATVGVCVKCRNWQGERGRHGRQRLVYAFWGLAPASVDWVRQVYRTRFGIETSYRQMNQAKVATTTRNPVVRLFLVGVALVLRNVWVWLHWEQLSMPRKGGRVVRLDRLPFKTLLLWLLHVAEEQFGRWDMTNTERPPLQPHAA